MNPIRQNVSIVGWILAAALLTLVASAQVTTIDFPKSYIRGAVSHPDSGDLLVRDAAGQLYLFSAEQLKQSGPAPASVHQVKDADDMMLLKIGGALKLVVTSMRSVQIFAYPGFELERTIENNIPMELVREWTAGQQEGTLIGLLMREGLIHLDLSTQKKTRLPSAYNTADKLATIAGGYVRYNDSAPLQRFATDKLDGDERSIDLLYEVEPRDGIIPTELMDIPAIRQRVLKADREQPVCGVDPARGLYYELSKTELIAKSLATEQEVEKMPVDLGSRATSTLQQKTFHHDTAHDRLLLFCGKDLKIVSLEAFDAVRQPDLSLRWNGPRAVFRGKPLSVRVAPAQAGAEVRLISPETAQYASGTLTWTPDLYAQLSQPVVFEVSHAGQKRTHTFLVKVDYPHIRLPVELEKSSAWNQTLVVSRSGKRALVKRNATHKSYNKPATPASVHLVDLDQQKVVASREFLEDNSNPSGLALDDRHAYILTPKALLKCSLENLQTTGTLLMDQQHRGLASLSPYGQTLFAMTGDMTDGIRLIDIETMQVKPVKIPIGSWDASPIISAPHHIGPFLFDETGRLLQWDGGIFPDLSGRSSFMRHGRTPERIAAAIGFGPPPNHGNAIDGGDGVRLISLAREQVVVHELKQKVTLKLKGESDESGFCPVARFLKKGYVKTNAALAGNRVVIARLDRMVVVDIPPAPLNKIRFKPDAGIPTLGPDESKEIQITLINAASPVSVKLKVPVPGVSISAPVQAGDHLQCTLRLDGKLMNEALMGNIGKMRRSQPDQMEKQIAANKPRFTSLTGLPCPGAPYSVPIQIEGADANSAVAAYSFTAVFMAKEEQLKTVYAAAMAVDAEARQVEMERRQALNADRSRKFKEREALSLLESILELQETLKEYQAAGTPQAP